MLLQFKRGVNTEGVLPQVWFALGIAQEIYARETKKPLIVTSLDDGTHKKTSKHYKGLGADLRTKHLTAPEVAVVFKALQTSLEPLCFDVVLEGDHIHIEYDPKQGEAWLREGVA